jgi:hypothetical protein
MAFHPAMETGGRTMPTALEPIELPDWAWERAEVRQALRARDMGAVFRQVQQYAGASQSRIAVATGMTQARINEIINRRPRGVPPRRVRADRRRPPHA